MNNQNDTNNNGGKEKRAERDSNFFCRLSGLFAVFDKAKSFSGGVAPNDWLITSFTASVGAKYHEADNGNFFNFVSKNKARSKYLANLERGDRVVIEAHPETTTGQDGKKYMQWVIDMATIVSNRNNQGGQQSGGQSQQSGNQQSGGQQYGGGQPTGGQYGAYGGGQQTGGYPQGGGQPTGGGYPQGGMNQSGQQNGGQPQGSGQYPAGGAQYGSYTPPVSGGYPQGAPSGQPAGGGQPSGGGSYPSGGQPAYPQGQYGGGQPSGGQPTGGGQPGGYPQGGGQPSGGTPYPDGFGMGDDDDPFGLNSGAPDNY